MTPPEVHGDEERPDPNLALVQRLARELPEAESTEALFASVGEGLRSALGLPALHLLVEEDRLGVIRLPLDSEDSQDWAPLRALLRGRDVSGQLVIFAPPGHEFWPQDRQLVDTVAELIAGVLRQQALYETVLKTNARLARLDDLTRELNASTDLQAIVSAASGGMRDMLPVDGFGLYLLEGGNPTLLAWEGSQATLPKEVLLVDSSDQPLLGSTEAPVLRLGTQRIAGRSWFVELLRGGSHAVLGMAVLRLDHDIETISDDLLPLVSAMAGHVAIALHNAQLMEEMQRRATYDDLTGLAGRTHFSTELHREIARARRRGQPLAMLMVDADHFKELNDTYGHMAGDAALVAIAESLRQGTRSIDVLGRLGGEEFGVLLPATDADTATAVAERLRASIEALNIPWKENSLRLTVSIGLAEWDTTMAGPDLSERSDLALYAAKNQGRNRVCPFIPSMRALPPPLKGAPGP